MKTTARRLAIIAMVMVTIGCDRVTKRLATAELAGAPRQSFLADTVRLQYEENAGAFLSLGESLPDWTRVGLFVGGTGQVNARVRRAAPEPPVNTVPAWRLDR